MSQTDSGLPKTFSVKVSFLREMRIERSACFADIMEDHGGGGRVTSWDWRRPSSPPVVPLGAGMPSSVTLWQPSAFSHRSTRRHVDGRARKS